MTSVSSVRSFTSQRTQNVLDEVASKTSSKIYSLEGIFGNEEMRVAWNGFGLYISKNMRTGRGVQIAKFGTFTFTPPEVRLKGVTNPVERDQRPRNPVFIISKDFVLGVPIKSGIFFHQEFGSGMRAYSVYGSNGEVPIAKANFTEVASYANMTKDNAQTVILRIIKHLSDKARTSGSCIIDIPSVGTFMVRNNIAAVKFNEFLQRDTRNILSQSLDARKTRGNFSLTKDNLKKFAILNETQARLGQKPLQFLQIDQKAKTFLQSEMGLFFDDTSNPMRRTITGFDRSLNTRNFKGNASALMASQTSKFNQSMMRKTLGSSSGGFRKTLEYDYNMALKLLRQWIFRKSYNSEEAFLQFMQLAKGKKDLMAVFSDTDIWNGCKHISIDLTQQQAHELFRLLDFNQDGVVSLEDWVTIIKFDSNNLLKRLKRSLRDNKISENEILTRSGLAGLKNVDVFKLQKAILKLSSQLKEEEAYNLARYMCGDDKVVPMQRVLEQLGHFDERAVKTKVGSDWEKRFLERIKRVMTMNDIFEEELLNKFEIYDPQRSGEVSQTQFKQVLTSLGISLTVTEIIKAIRQLSTTTQSIDYTHFVDKLRDVEVVYDKEEIEYQQFLQKIQPMLVKGNFGVKLPISVGSLASELQSTLFTDQSEQTIKRHLTKLDVDKNGEISVEDIESFKHGRVQIDSQKMSHEQIEALIKQLKEKCNTKRISLHELFKMLDVKKNGFVTPTEWDRIDKILPLTSNVKKTLFEYIDAQKLSMIDYRAFLDAMETNKKRPVVETFDWVEECLGRLKDWFGRSNLLPADAFKVVDRDFDSYIGEKDLSGFLQDNLKYQPKQINHGRIQKLLKVMDTYKRGKIDMVDFIKIVTSDRSNNWIQNAKQQIGLAISRKFKNLTDAFNQIGRTEPNILFTNFQPWIQSQNILNGFMLTEVMLKELFASLDPHKKGYLSFSDFSLAFGNFDWKSSVATQFIQTLQTKFRDIKDAFKHLCKYNSSNVLTKDQFSNALSEIFGDRFKIGDENELWKQLAVKNETLTFERFNEMFGRRWKQRTDALDHDFPRDDWVYQDYDIIRGTVSRSLQHAFKESDDLETQCRKMVQTVKGILRSSPKTLEQAFLEFDKDNRGTVTNLEFRHAFRNLNIALTSKQIDLMLNFCESNEGNTIHWRQFIKKFQIIGDRKKIIDRTKIKMKNLSDNIHFYMISSKDAYRKYNNPTTGYMSFEEFYKMLTDLFALSNDTLPQYSIIKEMFDFIDIRGDNKLDYQEWVQTFRNYKPPSLIQGTRAPVNNLSKSKSDGRLVPEFVQSPQFEALTQLLSRNRKYLLQKFDAIQKSETTIDYQAAAKILKALTSENKLDLNDEIYRSYLAFAMKGDKVDYNQLLQSLKYRAQVIVGFPKKQVF